MDESVMRAIGIGIRPNDLVLLVTKDGLSDEDLEALDPMIQELSETLSCSIVTMPDMVFQDIKVLDINQLLSLRESIDEAIASKMTDNNTPIA